MSDKHTPGPWRARPEPFPNSNISIVTSGDFGHMEVATVWSRSHQTRTETETNARLIAMAPVLLEAAQRLLDYFNSPNDHPEHIKDDVIIHLGEAVELAERGER